MLFIQAGSDEILLDDAIRITDKFLTEDWLEEYNAMRPHQALGNVPPYQYAFKTP